MKITEKHVFIADGDEIGKAIDAALDRSFEEARPESSEFLEGVTQVQRCLDPSLSIEDFLNEAISQVDAVLQKAIDAARSEGLKDLASRIETLKDREIS
ncbi:MAG: hypothetical protein ACRC62_04685 [Microcoleus sp.]